MINSDVKLRFINKILHSLLLKIPKLIKIANSGNAQVKTRVMDHNKSNRFNNSK